MKSNFLLINVFIVLLLSTIKTQAQEAILNSKRQLSYFTIGGVALHPSQKSVFVMAGVKKDNLGLFLKYKTNGYFKIDEENQVSSSTEAFYDGNIYKGRHAIIVGCIADLKSPFSLYAGLGYGKRAVNWSLINDMKYYITDISHKGMELEAGGIYQFKKLFASAGFSVTSFSYLETNLGMGYSF